MKLIIFSVFDSKGAFFGKPFFGMNEGSAIRDFGDGVNDGSIKGNSWYAHPEDYSLFRIGTYEDATGEIIPELPKNLITASALKTDYTKWTDQELVNGTGPKGNKVEVVQ